MLSVNEYFAGKVKSIGFENGSLGRSSVGVMEAGEYNFSTAQPEEMTVIAGSLNVMLPGATEWVVFGVGDSFLVPGKSEFTVQVCESTAYLCRYL
ncbi:pyrimidine/purine nucleoside phosphorylase [Leminorella richardii]|nr:pyrimidine/purine nucleoside phosphorylase [Leminorella richardii]